jgi:predicted RNA-binding Zn-ribbon protein involved in translation (DUF1610 family)
MTEFREIAGDESTVRYSCGGCGNRVKKRRDSFLPGAHMIICAQCGNSDSEIATLSGETVGVRSKDSAGRVG